MKKTVWVSGAKGQLGLSLQSIADRYTQFNFLFTDIDELDLCNQEAVNCFFQQQPIQYVINCAAYTAVDLAEDNPEQAYLINKEAVAYLAQAAAKNGAVVLHISTDYVFDGESVSPYKEKAEAKPQTVYGKSKLEGEQVLQKLCPESIIVRTSWLYSPYGNNFVKTMLRLGKEKDQLRVVANQKGTPTYALDLATALLDILVWVEKKENLPVGIYHYSNLGETTWYDFARTVHQLAKLTTCSITAVGSADYPTRAHRPTYSVLCKDKIQQTFQLQIPNWKDSLGKCIPLLLK